MAVSLSVARPRREESPVSNGAVTNVVITGAVVSRPTRRAPALCLPMTPDHRPPWGAAHDTV
jgi:hypothetical protein